MTGSIIALAAAFGVSPVWASQDAPDQHDAALATQCTAAAKWIAAAKRVDADADAGDGAPPTRPSLREQLVRRAATDQEAREKGVMCFGWP